MQSNFLRIANKTFSELPRALLQKITIKAFTRSITNYGNVKSTLLNLSSCSRNNLLSTSSRQILSTSISLAPIKRYHGNPYIGLLREVPTNLWIGEKFIQRLKRGGFSVSWDVEKFSYPYSCKEEIKDTSDIKKIIPSFCLQPFNNNNSKLKEEALNIEKSISAYRLKYFNEHYDQMVRNSYISSLASFYKYPNDSHNRSYAEYAGGLSLSYENSAENNFIIFGLLVTFDSFYRENMDRSESLCYIPFMLQYSDSIKWIGVSNSWETLILNLSDIDIKQFIEGLQSELMKENLVRDRSLLQIKEALISELAPTRVDLDSI